MRKRAPCHEMGAWRPLVQCSAARRCTQRWSELNRDAMVQYVGVFARARAWVCARARLGVCARASGCVPVT